MNNTAKINLSKEEWLTIKNTDFFRYKKEITHKVFNSFGSIVNHANSINVFNGLVLPNGTDNTTGKISKGENYLGLPYLVLDYPRKFTNSDVFAIRTILWWGNFISCTLLLSGQSAESYRGIIKKKYALLSKDKPYICIHESPWQHHFNRDNFKLVSKLTRAEYERHIDLHPFIKIAFKLPITKLEGMEAFAVKSFEVFKACLEP